MDFVMRWDGSYFGWIEDGELFTKDGRHVARRVKGRFYRQDGSYLGELRDGRLITRSSLQPPSLGFLPARLKSLPPRLSPAVEQPRELPDGFQAFPAPDSL